MIRPRARCCCALACALSACGDGSAIAGEAQAVPIERTDSAGVEIASLGELPSLLDESFRWQVRVVSSFSTEPVPGAPLVYDPVEIVPLSAGRLLVLDGAGTDVVSIWDAERGALLHRFGRRGEGPGELSGNGLAWEADDGSIVIVDPPNRKRLTFSAEGALLDEQPVEVSNRASYWIAERPGGGVIMESFTFRPGAGPVVELLAWGADGRTLEPFAPLSRRADHRGRPEEWQDGRPMWVALDSAVVTTRSDLPAFQVYDAAGRLLREIRLPLSVRTLGQVELQALQAEQPVRGRMLHEGPMALHNYLYTFGDTAFATFQNGMWRAAEDVDLYGHPALWRVISVRGAYMGTIAWPSDFQARSFAGDRVWGIGADSLGIPLIQQLALEPPPALRRAR